MFAGRLILDDLEGQFLSGLFQKVPSAHGKWAQKPPIFMVSNINGLFSRRFVFSRGGWGVLLTFFTPGLKYP